MANRFLSNIRINDAYTFPASDGNDGQVITTDGAGNLAFENISPDAASVIYRDNFTGDGSTVTFDLQNSITDEDQTQIYIDGVYQEKSTYSISGTTITFTTAPISGHSVEVISISSINTGPTVLYQDNFTGNGSATAFTLGQEIDNEIKTFIFLNGVYQFKNTYTVDGATLTFDTAPANGVAIEVVSIASAVQSDSLQAGAVIIPVKNTHTASIAKGTPVYITGNVGASERLQIAPADASNSAKMPSAGLLLTTLAVNEEGYVITGGYLRNLTTDTIDGTSTSSNDTVYVKPGGGLTMTKPTGSNLIQNIAKVARSSGGSSGSLLVSSILRTNDVPNLTTGKIWVGDSNTVESTVIHLDESNNRLGINNNSPNYSLDVTGDANISSNVIIGGNLTVDGTQTILNTQTVEVEDNILQLNTTQGSPDTATATTSGISIYRGDGVTQASFIFDDADDTWDLTNNLVVDGNATFAGSVTIDSSISTLNLIGSNTGASLINFADSDDGNVGRIYYDHTNNFMQFKTNDSEKMRIDSSGNVGIGTSSPSDPFHLSMTNGDIRIDAETDRNHILSRNSNDSSWRDLAISAMSGQKQLVLTTGGNVGIGETSPSSSRFTNSSSRILDISGDAVNRGGVITLRTSDNSKEAFLANDAGIFQIGMYTNNDIAFYTNNTEKMRIDSSGSVGINVTSPQNKLAIAHSVSGDSRNLLLANTNDTNGDSVSIGFSMLDNNTYVKSGIFFERTTTQGRGSLHLAVNNEVNGNNVTKSDAKLTINNSGNVGIGTTSPDNKLDVRNGELTVRPSSSGNGGLGKIGHSSSNAILQLYDSSGNEDVRISTSLSSYFNGGNVGIGTTSPAQKLHVMGTIKLGGYSYIGEDLSDTDSLTIASDHTESIHFAHFTPATSTYSTNMIIDSSGNVGIGTTSPTYGKITVTESGNAYTGDYIYGGTNGSYGALRCTLSASNSPSFIDFFRSSYSTTVPVGAIVTSGSNCLYQSYSDYRMKENVSELTGALDKVNNIQPKIFNYKEDTETTYQGFIAHELQEVVPQAVSGKKDEVNEDGTPKYQGVDNSHIVPLLVGAIQELKAEIELLKTQIN